MKLCKNCNTPQDDESIFCPNCGSRLIKVPDPDTSDPSQAVDETFPAEVHNSPEKTQSSYEEVPHQDADAFSSQWEDDFSVDTSKHTAKKLSTKKIILMITGVFLALAVLLVVVFTQMSEQHLKEKLAGLLDGAESCASWTADAVERFKNYPMTDDEQASYQTLLSTGSALEAEDYKGQIAYIQDMKKLEKSITDRLYKEATQLLEELRSLPLGYASDDEKQTLSNYGEQMEALIAAAAYQEIDPLADTWRSFAQKAAEKKTGYAVQVMQYDFSQYPKVRVYLDIQDESSGQVLTNLSQNMFYVSERDARTKDFLPCAVHKAVQLNENERLNINMLADTSGSMEGQNLSSAIDIMQDFLSTVQFSSGDLVKLTPFNSVIEKFGSYSNDIHALNAEIDSYSATGQTKLYDSIIYGVQDVATQEGAKCVLAFTDGMDVGSFNTASDVIDIVSQYNIPVFIVRIGDSTSSGEDANLREIAAASGGSFKNFSTFSADLTAFYDQIYRQVKQYYVVEFDALESSSLIDPSDYSFYVQNQDKGGEEALAITPVEEVLDSLLGGYLRSYITDLNNHSYQELENYVGNSNHEYSIQSQMKKQVSGGFGNIEEETLMSYHITSVTMPDANTICLSTSEDYDVVYFEPFGTLKKERAKLGTEILSLLSSQYGIEDVSDSDEVRVWYKVNQAPEYVIKKDSDGHWKFSHFAKSIDSGLTEVYDAEVY